MIWIRADANSEIGMGHMMRCLSIAQELDRLGKQVCFLLADEAPASFLLERKQKFHVLHTDYRKMEQELPVLLPLLQEKMQSLVLFDSYFVTQRYLKEIAGYARTVYLDDKNMFSYPVDAVINYNIYGKPSEYGKDSFRPGRMLLTGPAYAPLRKEFQGIPYIVRDRAENILITTGGSDKYFLAGKILESALAACELAGQRFLQFHVVSGAFNQNLPRLLALSERYSNVHIHRNVTEMAKLMQDCDIAVTAGGSTMYELCAVGVPMICFSFVDNQERIVETFAQRGLVCYGGNFLKEKETMAETAARFLLRLVQDKEARASYSRRERELVDGFGAGRIAEALCRMENGELA